MIILLRTTKHYFCEGIRDRLKKAKNLVLIDFSKQEITIQNLSTGRNWQDTLKEVLSWPNRLIFQIFDTYDLNERGLPKFSTIQTLHPSEEKMYEFLMWLFMPAYAIRPTKQELEMFEKKQFNKLLEYLREKAVYFGVNIHGPFYQSNRNNNRNDA